MGVPACEAGPSHLDLWSPGQREQIRPLGAREDACEHACLARALPLSPLVPTPGPTPILPFMIGGV